MDRHILQRIEELNHRLRLLRSRATDSMSLIGIEALEQELARTARRLPREWDLVRSAEIDTLSGDDRADLRS